MCIRIAVGLKAVIVAVMLGSLLGACSGEVEVSGPPPIRPVKIYTVEEVADAAIRRFPASIRAAQRADLAFRVPGVLQQMLVREGQRVQEGELLASLDPTDYKLQLQDRQATFDNAKNNFDRGKELIGDGNISRTNYDRMEAAFKTAQAALNQAKQDLEYTQLRAPFEGRVATREVENFEEVIAKQTIIRYQSDDVLDVVINMPESLVRSIRPPAGDDPEDFRERTDITAFAVFEGQQETRFPLSFKEVATRADPQTQTFQVTLAMERPATFRVLPGMTANVDLDLSTLVDVDLSRWIPASAVVADSGLNAHVWLLDDGLMAVSSHPVTIGRMADRSIEIKSGLTGGEEIVSIGAHYLAEGMAVTRMKVTEQAIPREDESN